MVTLTQTILAYLGAYDKDEVTLETRKILVKEYLQSYVLFYLYNHPQYRFLNFYGGTCAKVVYGLNRLSEDIDLDNTLQVDISKFGEDLLDYFQARLGLKNTELHTQMGEFGVYRFTLKLPVLYDLGLSVLTDEKLHIKVEISSHHQTAEIIMSPVLQHGQSYVARHFDLPSLMAGKMIACLERNFHKGDSSVFVKGRDFYDLIWYMQQKIMPNAEKLKNDGKYSRTVAEAFKELGQKIKQLTRRDLEVDITPLFVSRSFTEAWLDNFHDFYERYVLSYK